MEVAKRRFKTANEGDKKQRDREKEDLSFYEGEGQWPDEIRDIRKGQNVVGNVPAVPARPCLTIDMIRDPIRRVLNDELEADFGISIIPADDFGGEIDENEIELREGLVRRIQRESEAQDAMLWGASRAVICGRGYFCIKTKDVDADSMDQEIYFERLYDQFSVLVDPAHEQPDGSDIEYAFIGRDMPWERYRQLYGKKSNGSRNKLADSKLTDSDWRAFCDEAPEWVRQDATTQQRFVRVTEYWYTDYERYEIVMLNDGRVVRADTVDEDTLETITDDHRRMRVRRKVKQAVIDGISTLEETDWPGKWIPIVKIVGEEIHAFDDQRRMEGMVRPSRDPQYAYNVMVSTAVETIGLAPKAPFIAAAGQTEGFDDMWKTSAVRNWPILFYKPMTDETGQQMLPPPQRSQGEPANIQSVAMMMQTFVGAIGATIGRATLDAKHPEVRSGTMATALLDESLRGTNNFMANLVRSARFAGRIVNDLLYPIYGIREGRIASIVNPQNKTKRVMIGQPFVTNPQNGRPQPVPPMPPGQPMPMPQQGQPEPKEYRLTEGGSFNVAIKVSKYYETQLEEKLTMLAGMIEKNPEMLGVMGDMFFEMANEPELAQRFGAMLAPPVQAVMRAQKGIPPDPRVPQLEEMLRGLSGEMQQLKADKHARIEQSAIKAQSDAQTTALETASKERIAELNASTQIAIAEMKSQMAEQTNLMKQLIDAQKLEQEKFRTVEAFMEEKRLGDERTHDMGMAHVKHVHAMTQAQQEHEHAKAEMSHEAAVMPKVNNGSGND